MSAKKPDRQFLDRLYSLSPGYFTVVPFENGAPVAKGTRWFGTDEIGRAVGFIRQYRDRYDMYVSVGTWSEPAKKGRGKGENVISLAGLWADVDIGTVGHHESSDGLPNPPTEQDAMTLLDAVDKQPTAVVHTGGGLHAWYWFEKPWVFDSYEQAKQASEAWQKRLVKAGEDNGWHVDFVPDLARILRVPGTFNHKTGALRPVRLCIDDGARVYDPADFAPESGAGQAQQSTVDDEFRLSWNEILEPHGWTLTGEHDENGDPFWYRPGKGKGDGKSAVTHPHVMYSWSASADLPPDRGLSKLQVYAHLDHGGDLDAARQKLGLATSDRSKVGKLLWRNELGSLPPVEPLIEGVVSHRASVVMVGPSNIGKTFCALGMAASIATGVPWLGHEVHHQGPVLYVVGEGANGLDSRLTAWEQAYHDGHQIPDDLLRFSVLPGSLRDPGTWQQLQGVAEDIGAQCVMFDTLSSLMPDGDETKDAPVVMRALVDLGANLDGTAMLLHHPGWSDKNRVRGGSQLECNVDEVLLLKRLGDDDDENQPEFTMRRKKVKNGPDGYTLALRRVNYGPSQIVEVSDTAVGRNAVRDAEREEIARWLYQHGALDGTQRAAVACATKETQWSKHKIEDACRMWRDLDPPRRSILSAGW